MRPRRRSAAAIAICVAMLVVAGCRAGATRGGILYADALEHLADGDTVAAMALLETARYESPHDSRIQYQLGALLAAQPDIASRAHGESALREAVRLDPDHGDYRATLGELLYSQGFIDESAASMRNAVRLDPTLANGWYYLGLALQRQLFEEPGSTTLRDSVILCFENTIDNDAANDEARWRLAYLLLLRGQPERAAPIARGGVRLHACPDRFGLLQCAIETRAHRPLAATAILDSTLACLRPGERDSLFTPQRLMAPDSLPPCWPCTPAELDSLRQRFWWQLDPTPTSLVNERLLEHVQRLVDADFWFGVPKLHLPGRDSERGEVWIRYGKPELMWASIELNERMWTWAYADPHETFQFADAYLNSNYLRLKRTAWDDFMHPETFDIAPARTRLDFGPQPSGWQVAMRRFRGTDGRTRVEVAYEFRWREELDSLRVETAAWEGMGNRVAVASRRVEPAQLWHLDDGRAVGRWSFELPSIAAEDVEIGLQATAFEATAVLGVRGARRVWTGFGRDTLLLPDWRPESFNMSDLVPAHVLRSGQGGDFDWGGDIIAVPRIDTDIRDGVLRLYFEIYPTAAWLATRHSLSVTYRVTNLPANAWRFRDQFDPDARARHARRTAVESTFQIRPRHETERQELEIDVRSLAPGNYELTVELQVELGWNPVRRSLFFTIPKAGGKQTP